MKIKILAILTIFAVTACAQSPLTRSEAAQSVLSESGSKPGMIYIMRHVDKASSENERAPAPDGYGSTECQMATGLNAEGVARAEKAAQQLSGVDFAASYSSKYCRTAHTAKIVSGLSPAPTLTDPDADRAAFIAGMTEAARGAGGDILFVMHSNWIGALFAGDDDQIDAPSWAAPQCYGDVRAFRIEGDRWVYVGSYRDAVTDLKYYECANGH